MDRHQEQPRSKASTAARQPQLNDAKLNDKLIAERVTTLLSHYWTAAEDHRLRELQISDWLDDLGEFPAGIVADACLTWRRQPGGKRPTPGDIRALCLEAMPKKSPPPSPVPRLERVNHTPDTVRDNWRSLPFPMLTAAEQKLFCENLPKYDLSEQ